MIMIAKDGFDAGAEEVFAARNRGEKILPADLARIMRTAHQAWQVAHPEPVSSRPPEHKKRASVARNALFDALARETGSDPERMTRTAARSMGVALSEIREVSPDVTPELIARVVERYKSKNPTWPLTAMAICKHWGELTGSLRTVTAKKDPYLPPPDDWKDYAMKIFPGTLVSVTPWEELSISVRADILAKIP